MVFIPGMKYPRASTKKLQLELYLIVENWIISP